MIKKLLSLFCFILIICGLQAQNTIGLISYNIDKAYEGYNLIYPHNQPSVFLLNNCGEIVHSWDDEDVFRPGNMAYLQEDGSLIKCKRQSDIASDAIWAGGGGAIVEKRTWDNELVWQFELNDANDRLHHDISVMPNGNVLMIVWELKTNEEAIQSGRDTSKLAQDVLWPDYIIEYDPNVNDIVWEWHVWDHLIQDFDHTKDNFGTVANNPGLVDINYDTSDGHPDWMHSNAIDYNAELDQIVISVPTFHEIWVIDHSTTTEEAAGHTGGNFGKGGDLIYRWGNPAAYRAGDETDQKLFYQHDVHWIDQFHDGSHPDFGKFAIFNNRVGSDFSTAVILDPIDMYSGTYTLEGGSYLPTDFDKTIKHPTPSKMYSTGLSSYQILPNGNALICVGRFGYSFELTPDNEIVWEYITPIRGGNFLEQGDTTLTINNNLTFRTSRYPVDFIGFSGRDLSPKGYLEINPDETYCDRLVPVKESGAALSVSLYPNPTHKFIGVDWKGTQNVRMKIYDLSGKQLMEYPIEFGYNSFDIAHFESGIYLVTIGEEWTARLIKQ